MEFRCTKRGNYDRLKRLQPSNRSSGYKLSTSLVLQNHSTPTVRLDARYDHSPLRAGLLGLALGHVPDKWPWPWPWLQAMLRWSSSCCAAFKRCCRSMNTQSGMFAPDCSWTSLHYDAQPVSLNSTKDETQQRWEDQNRTFMLKTGNRGPWSG